MDRLEIGMTKVQDHMVSHTPQAGHSNLEDRLEEKRNRERR